MELHQYFILNLRVNLKPLSLFYIRRFFKSDERQSIFIKIISTAKICVRTFSFSEYVVLKRNYENNLIVSQFFRELNFLKRKGFQIYLKLAPAHELNSPSLTNVSMETIV